MNLAQKTTGLDGIVATLQRILAAASISVHNVQYLPNSGPGDALVRIPSHNVSLLLEYQSSLTTALVGPLVEHMQGNFPGCLPILCVRHLSWKLIEACKQHGAGAIDLDGNGFLQWPGFYLERCRPQATGLVSGTAGTVFTAKAMRIPRALLACYPRTWRQAELVDATGTSAGYVSRLTKRLAEEGYVSVRAGEITLTDADRLLDGWSAVYRFDRHRRHGFSVSVSTYAQGLQKLAQALQQSGVQFAFTGWSGANIRAPFTTAATYMAYVDRIPDEIQLVYPEQEKPNVLLYVPADEGVFQFVNQSEFGAVVSDPQLYVDLVRMPGRAKEQADALRAERLNFRDWHTHETAN